MLDQLVGTPLEGALTREALIYVDNTPGPRTSGSSFAALHAVGAAILVWSMLPDLTPDELRKLLRRASGPGEARSELRPHLTPDELRQLKRHAHSAPGDARSGLRPLVLTVKGAVAEARQHMIRRTLGEGPCSMQALAAITGLELRIVRDVLGQLLGKGEIRRLSRGRFERYELIQAA